MVRRLNLNLRIGSSEDTAETQYTGILDLLSQQSICAYGFRRLRKDYSGPLFRVRRLNANDEFDVYPLVNGEPDWSRDNLLAQNYFTTCDIPTWTLAGTTAALSGTEPSGQPAYKITENATTQSHRVERSVTWNDSNTSVRMLKIRAKANGRSILQVYSASDTSTVNIDLITGAYNHVAAGLTVTTLNLGGGWWEINVTKDMAGGTQAAAFGIVSSLSSARDEAYAGDGSSGVFLARPQAYGLAGASYIDTTTIGSRITGSCYLAKVYDQSGNTRHAVQATASSQMIITYRGTPYTLNSKAIAAMISPSRYIQTETAFAHPVGGFTIVSFEWMNSKSVSYSNYKSSFLIGADYGNEALQIANTTNVRLKSGRTAATNVVYPISADSKLICTHTMNNTLHRLRMNGVERVTAAAAGSAQSSNAQLTMALGGTSSFVGSAIMFAGVLSSNDIATMEAASSTYWSVSLDTAPTYTGVLNTLSQTPIAAYGVRKLFPAYAGSCMRVRRSGDNAELDIGFRSDGNLDLDTLLTHVGANNGLVVTWYDQTGQGNNATQSAAAAQPRIVVSGAVEAHSNGKIRVNFTDATHSLVLPAMTAQFAVSVVGAPGGTNYRSMGTTAAGAHWLLRSNTGDNVSTYTTSLGTSIGTWAVGELATFFADNTDTTSVNAWMAKNGAALASTGQNLTAAPIVLGNNSSSGGVQPFGGISEAIFLNTLSASDRTKIEQNQASFFGITLSP